MASEQAAITGPVDMPDRPRRSVLYLPASNLRAIDKARTLACDVVILDLEDSVAPDVKDVARRQAKAAIEAGGFGSREVVVRVNGLDTPWGRADMLEISATKPDAVLVPKISSSDDIRACEALIHACPVWAMIETCQSVLSLGEIVGTAREGRLSCLVMGVNDLSKEMTARLDVARLPFLGMLGLAVAAARAYGLFIIDGVYNAIDDDAGFAQQCRQAVEFGFDGKTLIHPRQIGLCNEIFTPDAASIAWAEGVVAAFEDSQNASKGAVRIDGQMVERLHLVQARRILSTAARS